MKALLQRHWQARSPAERAVIGLLAAVLAIAGYALLLHSAGRERERLRASVATLRMQTALLAQQAAEHRQLIAAPAPAASGSDLRALVQASAEAAGLSGALTRIDSPDAAHVQVRFGAIAFAEWLAWSSGLRSQQVRIEAARIEALAAPGMVGVSATFARTGSR